jgi:hypothetical protein
MVKKGDACSANGACPCGALMAIVIIVLIWISQATWSKIVITVAAALILLSSGTGMCKTKKK